MATPKRLLVTAALPYSNGGLHVGHIAGAYLPADIYVRYSRLIGRETLFVCGSDDHGVANVIAAGKEGKTPAEVAKHYHDRQAEDFKGLGIDFDIYDSTSGNETHTKRSQAFFKTLYDKGRFEKKESEQFYDEKKEMFLPDRFVEGTCGFCGAKDQRGDQCEDCGKVLDMASLKSARSALTGEPASVRKTTHWYLDLGQSQDVVGDWIEKADLRKGTRAYVRGLIEAGLVSRAMTRDIDWGIPVPLPEDPDSKGKVLYVWFDAPIGYISNTEKLVAEKGQGSYEDHWKSDDSEVLHFIGEDNTVFHCIIWIAMLAAEGSYKLPKGVVVNNFLNIQFPGSEAEKISKSRGAAVWISDFLKEGGDPEALRYYLTLIAPQTARTVFQPEGVEGFKDSDLADTLGNFVNRVLTFSIKYAGPEVPEVEESLLADVDREILEGAKAAHKEASQLIEEYAFREAQQRVFDYVRDCNKYFNDKAPWVSRKTDMDATKVTLFCSIQAIKTLSVILAPFLPKTAERIAKMLGLPVQTAWSQGLEPLPSGHPLGEPEILFLKSTAKKPGA